MGNSDRGPMVRVAVAWNVASVIVKTNGPVSVFYLNSGNKVAALSDDLHSFVFEKAGTKVRLLGRRTETHEGFTVVRAGDEGFIEVNGRRYRGTLEIRFWQNGLVAVNVLPVEEYLWSVVPCEMPYGWHKESLKAQAVAARTYTLNAIGKFPDRPFDVYASVIDQVYQGISSEKETTTQACIETLGEICTFEALPITAYYHAVSGGWTQGGFEVFGYDLPYLNPVYSGDENVVRWHYEITEEKLRNLLNSNGYEVGLISRLWVESFTKEGRAENIRVQHSKGSDTINANVLRRILGPGNIQSTYMTVEGQPLPKITREITRQDRMISDLPESEYSKLAPDALIPLPELKKVVECRVISSSGIKPLSKFAVLAIDGKSEHRGDEIWVAVPVRAGDLVKYGKKARGPLGDATIARSYIEDPGKGIGYLINGKFRFSGRGYGHGVGMSQHGARILALQGKDYKFILSYFYSGIKIEKAW